MLRIPQSEQSWLGKAHPHFLQHRPQGGLNWAGRSTPKRVHSVWLASCPPALGWGGAQQGLWCGARPLCTAWAPRSMAAWSREGVYERASPNVQMIIKLLLASCLLLSQSQSPSQYGVGEGGSSIKKIVLWGPVHWGRGRRGRGMPSSPQMVTEGGTHESHFLETQQLPTL